MFWLLSNQSEIKISKTDDYPHIALTYCEQEESFPTTQFTEKLRQSGFLCQTLSSPHRDWDDRWWNSQQYTQCYYSRCEQGPKGRLRVLRFWFGVSTVTPLYTACCMKSILLELESTSQQINVRFSKTVSKSGGQRWESMLRTQRRANWGWLGDTHLSECRIYFWE